MNSKFLIPFFLVVSIAFSVFAGEDAYKIEISKPIVTMSLVKKNGDIKNGYLETLRDSIQAHGNITKWESLFDYIDTSQKGGIIGEVAARVFFKSKGFDILESHYKGRLRLLSEDNNDSGIYDDESCTSKKGPDNGIDGVFIPKGFDINDAPVIVINEAKFRTNQEVLDQRDFGFVKKGSYEHNVQQAHTYWNRDRFNQIKCVALPYEKRTIIRTATLLDEKGNLSLFEIRDQEQKGNSKNTKTNFSSQEHGNSNEYKVFEQLSRID